MNRKRLCVKAAAVILSLAMIIAAAIPGASAASILSKTDREEFRVNICNEIVDVARSQIGFYEGNINKFTTWYYGYETDAYWCSIFVSWCAGQVGAANTAVPKRSACSSMKNWFELRGEYYPVDSDYVPQKGDIVFINTEVDGTDDIHHVEIITENGFFGSEKNRKIKCIGGNTSDLNFNGSEYVTEKTRPLNGTRAQIVGYANPSYEKCMGLTRDFNTFSNEKTPAFFRSLQSKLISIIYHMEVMWKNFTTMIKVSNENIVNSFNSFGENLNSFKIGANTSEDAQVTEVDETTVPA